MCKISAIIKFIAILCGIRLINAAKLPDLEVNCDLKNDAKIDSMVAKLMVFGEHGRLYPENRKQLREFCDDSTQILSYIEQYKNKCFTTTLKHFSSLFIYSNRNMMKRFCAKQGNKQLGLLWKAAKCVNTNKNRLNRCMGKLIDNFMGIKYADNKKKMPFVCCEYVQLLECFSDELKESKCKSEVDTLLNYLQSVMGNFLDSSCGEHTSETDKCQHLGKPPKRMANESTPKSILYPLFDIINSLPQ